MQMEEDGQRCRNGSVFKAAMLDQVFWNQWRHNNGWNPRSKLFEGEPLTAPPRSCGQCRSGSDMVIEATMLVPGDDEEALAPDRRFADGFVGGFDEALARGDASERVLRIPFF